MALIKTWRPWLDEHDEAPLFRTKPRPLVAAACPEFGENSPEMSNTVTAFRDELGQTYAAEMASYRGETWTSDLMDEIERRAHSIVRQWAREHGCLPDPEAAADAS